MSNIFSENPTWSIGIIVALFGVIAAHRLKLHRERTADFKKAAKDFTDTFFRELKDIYPIPANWPKSIDYFLRQKFPDLQAAVNIFIIHLPNGLREDFLSAWSIYRLGIDGREIDKQDYSQYMHFESNPNYKEQFKHNVDALLKFAKQPYRNKQSNQRIEPTKRSSSWCSHVRYNRNPAPPLTNRPFQTCRCYR